MSTNDLNGLFIKWYSLPEGHQAQEDFRFNQIAKDASNALQNCSDPDIANKIVIDIFNGFNIQSTPERNWIAEHLNKSEFDGFNQLFKVLDQYDPKIFEHKQTQNIQEQLRAQNVNNSISETSFIKTLSSNPTNYASNQFMWYIAQAILQSKKIQGDQIAPEVQQLLDILTLLAFGKASSIDQQAAEGGMQTSPFFENTGRYHRDSRSIMLEYLTGNVAFNCGLKFDQVHLVSSHFISEAIERQLGFCTKIQSQSHFESVVDNLLQLQANDPSFNASNGLIFLDISQISWNDNFDRDDFDAMIQSLTNVLNRKELTVGFDELFSIANRMIFFDYTKHNNQPMLLNFSLSGNDLANNAVSNSIENIMKHGFRISPDQTKAAMIKNNSLENILAGAGLSTVTLNTKGSKFPENVFNDIHDFLGSKAFKEFSELHKTPNAPPYLKVIPQTIASLIEGFKDQNIDQVFKDKNINDLLQASYYILKNAMGETILRKDDFASFSNNIELIQQIIQSILVITSPHDEKAFESAVSKKLTEGDNPVIPKELGSPKVHLKHAAMGGFSSILGATENQKQSTQINAACMADCYFELPIVLNQSSFYGNSSIDGASYRKFGDSTFDAKNFDPNKIPIDLFVCEFHHNLNAKPNYVYERENVKEYIKLIFKNGIAAEKMTVVIDNTIDLEVSDELRDLLYDPTIKSLIQDGRLNIVCLRSAQKYDMLGMDNYYGGIVTTINNGTDFLGFNERMDQKDDQLTGISYQGLTHLQKYGKTGNDDYKKSIMKNTQILYNGIPDKMIETESNSNLITVTQKNDPSTPFIRLTIKNHDLGLAFKEALAAFSKSENLLYTTRDSYGFMNMNKVEAIKPDALHIRLSPGLESFEDIQKYTKFFESIQNILETSNPNNIQDIIAKIKQTYP